MFCLFLGIRVQQIKITPPSFICFVSSFNIWYNLLLFVKTLLIFLFIRHTLLTTVIKFTLSIPSRVSPPLNFLDHFSQGPSPFSSTFQGLLPRTIDTGPCTSSNHTDLVSLVLSYRPGCRVDRRVTPVLDLQRRKEGYCCIPIRNILSTVFTRDGFI